MLSLCFASSGYAGSLVGQSRLSTVSMNMDSALSASSGKQDFLEADPYWDQSGVPVNTYKNKAPFTAKVVSTKRIVGAQATGETCHIIMSHEGKMPYWEGQSYGVIPPGTNPKNGKPNSVRLYSIASSRYGDDMTGTTTSLCVRRATYWCPELKADDPAKKGVCSNFLCDSKPGDELKLTGPSGKVMLIPEKELGKTDLIMVATGTGIAPYRSFIRRLFVEKTPYGEVYSGLAWLFLGVANTDALLYDDEWQEVLKAYPNNFRLDYALSREQTNVDGGKMYIQDKVKEYADGVGGQGPGRHARDGVWRKVHLLPERPLRRLRRPALQRGLRLPDGLLRHVSLGGLRGGGALGHDVRAPRAVRAQRANLPRRHRPDLARH